MSSLVHRLALTDHQTALVLSDMHLSDEDPALSALVTQWVDHHIQRRPSWLIMLGDLFDAWVGDDQANQSPAFTALSGCCERAHKMGVAIGVMAGNRDFLLGDKALARLHAQGLGDACEIQAGKSKWLLLHGDTLCTSDRAYQDFRAMVRSPQWQEDFLAKPLSERLAIAKGLRERSEQETMGKPMAITDVSQEAVNETLANPDINGIIHGHTHRPGLYQSDNKKPRWVLPDWCPHSRRGGGLWIHSEGVESLALSS